MDSAGWSNRYSDLLLKRTCSAWYWHQGSSHRLALMAGLQGRLQCQKSTSGLASAGQLLDESGRQSLQTRSVGASKARVHLQNTWSASQWLMAPGDTATPAVAAMLAAKPMMACH